MTMRACDRRFIGLLRKLPARLVGSLADRWAGVLPRIPRTPRERSNDPAATSGGSEVIAAIALLLATLPDDRLRPFLDGLADAILDDRLPRPIGTGSGRIYIEEVSRQPAR